MDFSKIVKWIVVIAIAVFVWKVGLPWAKAQNFGGKSASATGSSGGDSSCVRTAQQASERWGSGLGRFVNPPYDTGAWSSFKSDVESKIGEAESQCGCALESCQKVRVAMTELRTLVSEMDSSIRSGGAPPEDAVQQQAHIDDSLNEAADLVKAGK